MRYTNPLNPLQLMIVSVVGLIQQWQERRIAAYLEMELEIVRARYFQEIKRGVMLVNLRFKSL